MKFLNSLLLFFLCFTVTSFSQELQSPEEFHGYEIGTRFTRHADVVQYFEHLAENSPNLEYHDYGRTNEHRKLSYAVISSEANLDNLEEIRKNHLKTTGILEGNSAESEKAVVWLSYNVHGNEASSTEAAMKTAYELISSKKEWLENLVIILDPNVNPDGRDRYVNWYNQVKATPYNDAQAAIEHHEPWPGGRPNHYLFDLNRDWMWATQVETQQRLKLYNQWLPHIHVDFHEQGINSPYYFAPAAEPFHEKITDFQRNFQTEIGKNHARYFDKEGWLYFTGERFDLLYPSYGDTYPTFMGAIGMTYEQAGHGRAGLGIQTNQGYELTLVDRVAHHHTTGLSTVEMAAQNVDRLVSQFEEFYHNDDLEYKSFALRGGADQLAALRDLLDHHEISYGTTSENQLRGETYSSAGDLSSQGNTGTLVVSTNQPKGKMVSVLFEPQTSLSDSLTYDITAWSLPYAYGLEAVASTREIESQPAAEISTAKNSAAPNGAGYISKWSSMEDARFLADLLKAGIKVRMTELELETANQKFSPGSLVITKSDNLNLKDFDSLLLKIAADHNRQLTPAPTGFSSSGPDFGASSVKIINNPRIAVLRGEGTSSLSYGELWYFFEQDLQYPITSIGTEYFQQVNLSDFDILILPSGNYKNVLGKKNLKRLKTWLEQGGKVIALGSAVNTFAGKEGFSLKENKTEEEKDSLQEKKLIPYAARERENIKNLITGSIIETQLDNTHPMAFGYGDTYYSMKLSSDSYQYLEKDYTVGYLGENPEVAAGFAGSEAKEKIKNSMTFGEERMGRGSIIYMVDNPLFRAFWENGKLFFVNSIFFVNNDDYRNSK